MYNLCRQFIGLMLADRSVWALVIYYGMFFQQLPVGQRIARHSTADRKDRTPTDGAVLQDHCVYRLQNNEQAIPELQTEISFTSVPIPMRASRLHC